MQRLYLLKELKWSVCHLLIRMRGDGENYFVRCPSWEVLKCRIFYS